MHHRNILTVALCSTLASAANLRQRSVLEEADVFGTESNAIPSAGSYPPPPVAPPVLNMEYNLVDETFQVEVYENGEVSDLLDLHSFEASLLEPQGFQTASSGLRVLLLHSADTLDLVSSEAIKKVVSDFESGKIIIGTQNPSRLVSLQSKLGLQNADEMEKLDNAGGPTMQYLNETNVVEGVSVWNLLSRNAAGHLDELTVYNTGLEIHESFELVATWHKRHNVKDANDKGSTNPWNAIQTFEWSGRNFGIFENKLENAGTWRMGATIYYIDTDKNGKDWYRVDLRTTSMIDNYHATTGWTNARCGWWTDKMRATLRIDTPNGGWHEFMPSTTINSRSQGFTIGGGLTGGSSGIGGGVNGAYSQSYGAQDVQINVVGNTIENRLHWTADLLGCHNYAAGTKWYSDASQAAQTTFSLNPSAIVHVPKGSVLVAESAPEGMGIITEKNRIYPLGKYYAHTGLISMSPWFQCTKKACRAFATTPWGTNQWNN